MPQSWQAGANLIDLQFMGVPGSVASYAFDTGDGLALVDTGPSTTLRALEDSLKALGAELEDVRHLLLTHIHFDHAGAAGTLLERLPKAKVYVHQRGAKHLANPERLVASASQIYGDQMDVLWGQMLPIDPARMVVLEGGEDLIFSGGTVSAHYTPGHAVHHLAYHACATADLYVGDVGGIRIAEAQSPRPPTPPPDIDLSAWMHSIAVLQSIEAEQLHLAHFGSYPHTAEHWQQLSANIRIDAGRVEAGLEAGQNLEQLTRSFTADLKADLEREGDGLAEQYLLACPPWMSVQGLLRFWQRQAVRGQAWDQPVEEGK